MVLGITSRQGHRPHAVAYPRNFGMRIIRD